MTFELVLIGRNDFPMYYYVGCVIYSFYLMGEIMFLSIILLFLDKHLSF